MTGAPPFPPQVRVTLANWQDPPFDRGAFQHVRELIPTAKIARGRAVVGAAARNATCSATLRSPDRERSVAELLEKTYADGFLVLHQGRILAEHYFNDMAPDVPVLSDRVINPPQPGARQQPTAGCAVGLVGGGVV